MAALAFAALAVIAGRGLLARGAVDRALDRDLGGGWRDALASESAARRRHRPSYARILLWPIAWVPRPPAIERVRNIRYGDGGKRNLLDLYRHRSHPANAPTLVYFHGGGFSSGRKGREALALVHRLASQGWVCITADYRLRPAVTFPDHLIDAKRVIAWVRGHGGEYGADPASIFVAGSSAGGHLAAMSALTPNEPEFQRGFEDADTSVAAAISLYGYLGKYYGQGPASSPRAYVRPDAPPFFLAQGDRDTYSPRFVEIARGFVDELRSVSTSPVVYAELPWGQHGFDVFHSLRFEAVIDGIETFAAVVRSRRVQPRAEAPS